MAQPVYHSTANMCTTWETLPAELRQEIMYLATVMHTKARDGTERIERIAPALRRKQGVNRTFLRDSIPVATRLLRGLDQQIKEYQVARDAARQTLEKARTQGGLMDLGTFFYRSFSCQAALQALSTNQFGLAVAARCALASIRLAALNMVWHQDCSARIEDHALRHGVHLSPS